MKRIAGKLMVGIMFALILAGFVTQTIFAASQVQSKAETLNEFNDSYLVKSAVVEASSIDWKDDFLRGKTNFTSIALDAMVTTYVGITEFTVTFNSNGGTEIEEQNIAYNGQVEIPEDPEKEGYIFENWYKDEALTEVFDFDTLITSEITLYAKYIELPKAELTVNIEGNGSVVDWTSGSTKNLAVGTTIILTAVADENSKFYYWKDSVGRVISDQSEFIFDLACEETLTAVFITNNKNIVIFQNDNGEVLQNSYISDVVSYPKAPSMYGYIFIKWDKTIEQIKAATEDIVVTAVYVKTNDTVAISVYRGTGSGEYNLEAYVKLVADVPESGLKFSHWEDDLENILCYSPEYSFYATRDVKISAVFVPESEEIVEEAGIDITNVAITDNKISFVAERVVPHGTELISHGIIVTKNTSIGNSETEFIIGGTDVLKATSVSDKLIGTFILNKVAALNETWYARGYVIYMDIEGDVYTVYSSIELDTMN